MFGKKLVLYVDNGKTVEGEVVNEGNEAGWNPFKWWDAIFKDHGVKFSHAEVVEATDVKDTFNIKGHEDYQYQIGRFGDGSSSDVDGTDVRGWGGT